MNTNENSPKAGPRLKRIQKAGSVLKTVFFILALFFTLTTLLCGAGFISIMGRQSFGELSRTILAAGANLSFAVGAWFCYQLFALYSRGNLFTPEIVRLLRRIGCLYFLLMLVRFCCKMFLPGMNDDYLETANIGWGRLELVSFLLVSCFPGFLILFVAWIMDEGRKIQEEQELTV
jgi:hypothetical protein